MPSRSLWRHCNVASHILLLHVRCGVSIVSILKKTNFSLKTESGHDANFGVFISTFGCHDNNLQFKSHQSWYGNSWFSVF